MGRTLYALFSLVVAVFICPAITYKAQVRASDDGAAPILEEFKVADDGDVILLPVAVGDTTVPFVMDTGSSHTLFDISLRPMLGDFVKNVPYPVAGGMIDISFFSAPRARVGKLPLSTDGTVGVVDLKSLREVTGYKIAGIIGLDFLRQHIVRMDLAQGTVQILSAQSRLTGSRMNMSRDQGFPTIRAEVAGYGPVGFVVDTGQGGTGGLVTVHAPAWPGRENWSSRQVENQRHIWHVAAATAD